MLRRLVSAEGGVSVTSAYRLAAQEQSIGWALHTPIPNGLGARSISMDAREDGHVSLRDRSWGNHRLIAEQEIKGATARLLLAHGKKKDVPYDRTSVHGRTLAGAYATVTRRAGPLADSAPEVRLGRGWSLRQVRRPAVA